jgi:tetratricopeptide (TPR) repeat protein
MKEPTSPEEVRAAQKLRRSDPQRYLQMVDHWLRKNPRNSHAYFGRHIAWLNIGEPRRALEDLNKVIEFDPDQGVFRSRGEVYRRIGDYDNALADFKRGEAIDPAQWEADAFGLYYQADTHARLGNEEAALACCARLPEDFWTPGIHGAPGGGKAEIAETLRRVAAEARHTRM